METRRVHGQVGNHFLSLRRVPMSYTSSASVASLGHPCPTIP